MKLLITGAFGNLGMMCVRQSLAMGYAVRCFDVDNPATRERAAEFSGKVETVFGDIRDKAQLENLVAGVDAIIHNASLLPPMTDLKPQLADAINITATEELIRVAEVQPKKPVLLFPSSISVFGPAQIGRVMTANDPAVASDNYTRHKVTIEKALQASSLPWCILRVGVSVDSRTLKTDRATFTKLIATRADNPLEYVHPCDVALAMCRAVGHPEAVGKILLIGGGKSCQITQNQFLGTALRAAGLDLPPSVHGNNLFYTNWMDTTESQRILGFQQHDFSAYQQEMADKLRVVRLFVAPLRFLLLPLLCQLLLWLQRNPVKS